MSGRGFATRAIHAGLEADPHTGAIIPPVTLATTYKKDYGRELEVNRVISVPTFIDINMHTHTHAKGILLYST